ncbi:MAG: biosynthetic-type acetolactate synthase large subunit [Gracilimonas sp.]|uniref:biosynthetic-type acetolactate synthase large subunit n=1 Tax=Gracilimonas sp. TaxID=1974203 RepID=UPI003752F207|nr:biosynthetic-type acetolactate synthase large subunit [Gracilimonas sp.]
MGTVEAPELTSQPKTVDTIRMTGAEALVQILLKENVDTAFGYPGGAIMPVYDALYDHQDSIHHVLARHEQGAIHMAQGYARTSGKVGVCLATSGPGATNLITGIADAQIDSTPLVCITGQVNSSLLGSDAFQECDVLGISMPVTKWNFQITRAEEIPEALAKAFYLAKTGRPGPVVIDITKDAQFEEFDYKYEKCTSLRSYKPKPKLDHAKIEEAAELINNAERPYVLFGQGVILANAEKEFKQFIEKTGIPSAWTIMGLSALETDHPLNVGMLGMHGNYGPNLLTNECDVLIAVGMRFDDRVTGNLSKYAKQAKVIHLEIDPAEIDKNVPADVAVLGDAKESLSELIKLVKPKSYEEWLQRFRDCDEKEWEKVIKDELHPESNILSMGEVIRIVNDITNDDHILVTDVGQHQMVACRYSKFTRPKSNITSGGLGTMGFGLPAGIGAALGAPDRTVIVVVGDGGFQMTMQELATIYQTKVKVKVLLLNNEFLGMVRQWQQLFFEKRYSSTELINPDFQLLAKGFYIPTKKVTERENLEKAIAEFINYDGAYFLEVMVGKENNVFPMVPSGSGVAEIRLE